MVNKPKAIGTFAETHALKAILPYFPRAKRITQHGSADHGDIDSGDDGDFVFEVKGGKQCQQIGDGKLAKWMGEVDVERANIGKTWGVLIVQRAGFGGPNAHRWWAYVHLGDLARFSGGHYRPGQFAVARLELRDLLELLSDNDLTPDKTAPVSGEIVEEWLPLPVGEDLVVKFGTDATA